MAAGPQNLASPGREWKSSILPLPICSAIIPSLPCTVAPMCPSSVTPDGAITQSILVQRVVSVEARGHAHILAILTRNFPEMVPDCSLEYTPH